MKTLKLIATAVTTAALLVACDPEPPACAQGSDTYYDSATHTRKHCPDSDGHGKTKPKSGTGRR